MFFTQPHYNQILEILSSYKNHTATAKEIHKALNQFADISLVHTYNSLRSLIHLHVLTKQGQAYTINHRRIDRILQFAQKNKQQENMTQQRASLCDLNDEEHILVKANSLFVLDSTRSDAFAQICKKENPQEIYFYSSFAYHILGFPRSEQNFLQRSNSQTNVQYILGNDCFLNRHAITMLQLQGIQHVVCKNQKYFMEDGYVLDVVGDYIFELMLPPTIKSYFHQYFSYVNSLSEFFIEDFSELFHIKSKPTLKILRSKQKASYFKQILKKLVQANVNHGKID